MCPAVELPKGFHKRLFDSQPPYEVGRASIIIILTIKKWKLQPIDLIQVCKPLSSGFKA